MIRGDIRDRTPRQVAEAPPSSCTSQPSSVTLHVHAIRSLTGGQRRGTQALVEDAKAAGVQRLVFASTCSNYGRMADPTVPITEEGALRPVSLYAEQKVGIERPCSMAAFNGLEPTACALRPSTGLRHGCGST